MKKVLITLILSCIGIMTYAQSPLEVRVSELEKKIDEIIARTDALSQRLVEVEQLNIRLRKALDFGKPIMTIEDSSSITYHIIALEGSKKDQTVKIRMQVSTKNDVNCLMLTSGFHYPSMIDINGARYEATSTEIGNVELLEIYKDVPVNASITFTNIKPDSVVDIKLLKVKPTVDYGDGDNLLFKSLKIVWR